MGKSTLKKKISFNYIIQTKALSAWNEFELFEEKQNQKLTNFKVDYISLFCLFVKTKVYIYIYSKGFVYTFFPSYISSIFVRHLTQIEI